MASVRLTPAAGNARGSGRHRRAREPRGLPRMPLAPRGDPGNGSSLAIPKVERHVRRPRIYEDVPVAVLTVPHTHTRLAALANHMGTCRTTQRTNIIFCCACRALCSNRQNIYRFDK